MPLSSRRTLTAMRVVIATVIALAVAPSAQAHVSSSRLHRAVDHYAQRDIRNGEATAYSITGCARARVALRCTLTESGVQNTLTDSGGSAELTWQVRATIPGRYVYVTLAHIDSPTYRERLR